MSHQVSSTPEDQNQQPLSFQDRRKILLEELDNKKFGWFHVRACVVAGVGFFTDAYDLFAINIATSMLAFTYYKKAALPNDIDTGLKTSAQIGTLVGQLLFGWLADILGRKKMYGIELIVMIIATVGAACAADGYAVSVHGVIIFWRVIMGIGVGGDYPLSAIITSEFATTKKRGGMIATVFAMQGFGILTAAIVSYFTLLGFKSRIEGNSAEVDYCWRIVFGLGAVPAIVALYFRLTIPETPRYTIDIERDVHKATKDVTRYINTKDDDKSTKTSDSKGLQEKIVLSEQAAVQDEKRESTFYSWSEFAGHFGQWKNGKLLLGTSLSWFALDVAFYGTGLNNSIILNAIGYSNPNAAPYDALINIAIGNIIIAMLGTVPGYWFTVFTVDRWGRKTIQLMGFIILTVIFIVLGFAYDPILKASVPLFIVLFTLTQFFQNFGPNTTTFIIPGELFPTKYRSTAFGIAAASGKLGAIISAIGFSQLKDIGGKNAFVPHLFKIFALFMFIGLLATFLLPETKNYSLEELSGEDNSSDDGNDTNNKVSQN